MESLGGVFRRYSLSLPLYETTLLKDLPSDHPRHEHPGHRWMNNFNFIFIHEPYYARLTEMKWYNSYTYNCWQRKMKIINERNKMREREYSYSILSSMPNITKSLNENFTIVIYFISLKQLVSASIHISMLISKVVCTFRKWEQIVFLLTGREQSLLGTDWRLRSLHK